MAKVWAISLIVLAILGSAGLGVFLGHLMPDGIGGLSVTRSVQQAFEPPFGGKTVVRILILGEDNTGIKAKGVRGLSDAIMLMNLNLQTYQVSMLSIPRDTKIYLEGYGNKKINAAYKLKGPEKAVEVVSQLTGVMPDYYMETNTTGFKKTVDLVGGVDIDVEKNMHYVDHWGGLNINLKKGLQHMNGEKAMEYVRFRHDAMGDIWRVQRQQKFFVALAKRLLRLQNVPRLPQIIDSVKQNVDTNLSLKDMYELAKLPGKLDMSKAKTDTLPGAPESTHGGFWVPDTDKTIKVVQDLFFTTTMPGLPKVEVLNGSGTAGAAQTVADVFKQQGYEVIATGNAGSFDYPTSKIISHKQDLKGVEAIGKVVNSIDVKYQKSTKAKADVTVIVGKDCALISTSGG